MCPSAHFHFQGRNASRFLQLQDDFGCDQSPSATDVEQRTTDRDDVAQGDVLDIEGAANFKENRWQ
jgi:hypothetical protein